MPCNPLTDPACRASATSSSRRPRSAAGDVLSGIAQAITDGVKWIVDEHRDLVAADPLAGPGRRARGQPRSSTGCCRSPPRWRSAG